MSAFNIMVIAAFSITGLALLIIGSRLERNGVRFLGKPSINKALFYTGKITLFSSWAFFLLKAIIPSFGWVMVPPVVSWIAAVLLICGSLILILAFFQLGNSLRVGLPHEDTALITNGLYSFSRNPLYLGVFIICIASCIYFPNPVNILFAFYGMIVHHRIVIGEEKFLEERFGVQWIAYKQRVRRYL